MNRLSFTTLLLLSAVTLSSCGIQKQTQEAEQKPASAELYQKMQQMEPQFLYLAAQNALKDGNQKLAAKFLSVLIEKDPKAIAPHIQLTSLLLQLGDTDGAEKQIELLLHKQVEKGDMENLLLTQARLKTAKDQISEALLQLNKLFEINPIHLHGRDLQARILSGQNRTDEALTAINSAILHAELPEFRLLQAQLFLKQNQLKDAEISLLRIRKLAPDNDKAVILLSTIALQQKDNSKAESILRDFYNEFPNALRVGHALGKVIMQEKRFAEAIIIYRDLVSRSGNNPEMLKTLGMLYFSYKDFSRSEKTFRKLHQIKTDDVSRFYLAASLEALQRKSEAVKLYKMIDSNGPMGLDANLRLAGMEYADKRYNTAIQRLNTILEAEPLHIEAELMRSAIRLAQGEYKTVIRETEAILSKSKIHPQLLFNRAVAFDHLKQYEQLESMLNRLLSNHPKHSEAMNFLGYSYAVQGIHLDKAEQLILKALSYKPEDGYYLDSLAWVYFRQKNYNKALAMQRKAIAQINDDPVMFEHLGDMLWKLDEQQEARKAWKRAIELQSDRTDKLKRKMNQGLQSE